MKLINAPRIVLAKEEKEIGNKFFDLADKICDAYCTHNGGDDCNEFCPFYNNSNFRCNIASIAKFKTIVLSPYELEEE